MLIIKRKFDFRSEGYIYISDRKDETTNPKITIDGVSSWNFKVKLDLNRIHFL